MKKILIALLAGFLLFGCSDKKAEEKALLDDVLKVHDHVMGNDEQLMKNKMQLDTLAAHSSDTVIKNSAVIYIKLLNNADGAMDNWMHSFDPDYKGKSHDDVMSYLSNQKKQVLTIDTMLNSAVKKSSDFLSSIKSK